MREWVILMGINKEYGFIPVFKVSKIVEKEGGIHKYNALLKVEDGIRKYTVNGVFDEKIKSKLVEKIGSIEGILWFKIEKIY